MSQHPPSASPRTAPDATSDAAGLHAQLLWLARRAPSHQDYLARVLERLGDAFASPYGALHVQVGPAVVQEETHNGPTDPRFWRQAVQQFLTEALAGRKPRARLLSASAADTQIALLAVPLRDASTGVEGALALVVPADETRARTCLQQLEALAALTAAALALVGAEAARADHRGPPNAALGRAAGVRSPTELAFAITNSLRNRLSCEQVALGLVRGKHVEILSISGLDNIPPRSPGAGSLRAAMEECADFGEPIVCQQDRGWANEKLSAGHRLHQQWHAAAGGAAVASLPMLDGGVCVAVLSLRAAAEEPLRREKLAEISKLIEPFGPALRLVCQAHRGLVRHAWEASATAVRSLVGPGCRGRKLLTALALVAVAWFCCGTLPYELMLAAKVVPAEQRHLGVPFDGVLARVVATPGTRVRAGDVLCELDRRDLELEHQRLAAQRAVLEREETRALAARDGGAAQVAEANRRLVDAQLAINARRLEQTVIRAPFDGLVVSGDPRKQVGSVLAQGTPLYDVAPLENGLLEIEGLEAVTADLHAGLRGQFASEARPEWALAFEVTRVAPSAEARPGRNVYVVEAALDTPVDWLRPGMEGMAKVEVGPRRVCWLALHRVIDYLRLHFWL